MSEDTLKDAVACDDESERVELGVDIGRDENDRSDR